MVYLYDGGGKIRRKEKAILETDRFFIRFLSGDNMVAGINMQVLACHSAGKVAE